MFLNLPSIRLPIEFVTLASMNLQETRKDNTQVLDILGDNQGIYLVLEKLFNNNGKTKGLTDALDSMGWNRFREVIVFAYVYHQNVRKFPTQIDLTMIDDVIEFERKFEFITQKNSSRLFLFAFYLKLCDITFEASGRKLPASFLDVDEEFIKLLKLGKTKSDNADWLLLICWHLYNFFGFDVLKQNLMTNGLNFSSLYKLVDSDFKRKMSKNFMAYGSSINQMEAFLYEKV